MNLIVNADHDAVAGLGLDPNEVVLNAVALRVADAGKAYTSLVGLGAWPIQTRASTMGLNIPGIHGIGDSVIYFVDRCEDFSIYDVDFKYYPDLPAGKPLIDGIHFFGIAQYVGPDRVNDWVDFYSQLFGFVVLPYGQSFGILPRGTLMQSPCGKFYLQLIPPPENADWDVEWEEKLIRLAFGVPDIIATVAALRARGIEFEEREILHVTDKGALTRNLFGGMNFEFVASKPA